MDYDELAKEFEHDIVRLHRTSMQRRVSQISKGEMFILDFLLNHDGQGLPGNMGRAMEVSSARTAAVLNALERKGEILRLPDEEDHRRVRVVLTEAGKKRILRVHEDAHQDVKRILAELGDRDAAELLRLLNRLISVAQAQQKAQPESLERSALC